MLFFQHSLWYLGRGGGEGDYFISCYFSFVSYHESMNIWDLQLAGRVSTMYNAGVFLHCKNYLPPPPQPPHTHILSLSFIYYLNACHFSEKYAAL